jgi:hypothetical protein
VPVRLFWPNISNKALEEMALTWYPFLSPISFYLLDDILAFKKFHKISAGNSYKIL